MDDYEETKLHEAEPPEQRRWLKSRRLLMWALYIVGVQYKRGGAWLAMYPVAFAALVLDWAMNYTVFAVMLWDFPRKGEWTFSTRLERLVRSTGWRQVLAQAIAHYMLDPFDPDGVHIK